MSIHPHIRQESRPRGSEPTGAGSAAVKASRPLEAPAGAGRCGFPVLTRFWRRPAGSGVGPVGDGTQRVGVAVPIGGHAVLVGHPLLEPCGRCTPCRRCRSGHHHVIPVGVSQASGVSHGLAVDPVAVDLVSGSLRRRPREFDGAGVEYAGAEVAGHVFPRLCTKIHFCADFLCISAQKVLPL